MATASSNGASASDSGLRIVRRIGRPRSPIGSSASFAVHSVQRVFRARDAIEARRMRARDDWSWKYRRPRIGNTSAGGLRAWPKPSSVSDRRQRRGALHVRRTRAARQRHQPAQHVDIESRQRQRRPARPGGDVEQHDPAFALRPGGDQRRAVGKPRPGCDRRVRPTARPGPGASPTRRAEWSGLRTDWLRKTAPACCGSAQASAPPR